jgi:hypothetical protein
MSDFSINSQLFSDTCPACGQNFSITRGDILFQDDAVGNYSTAMHGCNDRLFFVAVALAEESTHGEPRTVAFFMQGWPEDDSLKMQISEPEESPFYTPDFEGASLSRQQAIEHPFIEPVLHIVDQISQQPEVHNYLVGQTTSENSAE